MPVLPARVRAGIAPPRFMALRHCAALMPAVPMMPRGLKASTPIRITKVKTTL
jgi:hypothetical protein